MTSESSVLALVHELASRIRRTSLLGWCGGRTASNIHIQAGARIFSREKVQIGSDVYIGPDAWIDGQGGVTIGSGTIAGPRLKIYSATHDYRTAEAVPYGSGVLPRPVVIGANCWIGGDVLIAPGADIGEGCIVGAGAVVAGAHPPCSVLAGNPARKVGERDRAAYEQLKREGKVYLRTWQRRRGAPAAPTSAAPAEAASPHPSP